jgi:hypothetical protein
MYKFTHVFPVAAFIIQNFGTGVDGEFKKCVHMMKHTWGGLPAPLERDACVIFPVKFITALR